MDEFKDGVLPKEIEMKTLLACLTLPLIAGAAWAQDKPDFGPGMNASPFAFAQSGKKAEHMKAAAAADGGGKVIGGQEAADGAWPWQVALMINGAPQTPEGQFCGGSMLLDRWVLTAAHCVHMQDDQGWFDLAPQQINIFVGSNTLAPGQGDLVPVEKIIKHPNYVGWEFDNDIAVIKLARAPNARYSTIKVPDQEFGDMLDQPGVTTIVTGWGLTDGGGRPETLRQAEIQMLDRDLCNQAMLEARADEAVKGFGYAVNAFGIKEDDAYALWDELVAKAPIPMSANMLCSGTYEGGKTACSGDSGGPLVVPLTDGSYIQAGVVSWGLAAANGQGCEETALFSAYTRVSNFLPWLEQTIGQN